MAGIGAGDVLDRIGVADFGHAQPGWASGIGDAAVRGPGAGADAVPDRRSQRRRDERAWQNRDRRTSGDFRHPGRRPFPTAGAFCPGRAVEEARAVSRNLVVGSDSCRHRHRFGRVVADPWRAGRRPGDCRDRLSQ